MAKDMQNENQATFRKGTVARKKKTVRLPINWFDAVIIVLIVVVAVLAISGTQLASLFGIGEDTESCTVEYMVMFSDVDQDLALAIGENAAVYGTSSAGTMGTVIADPEVKAHSVLVYADGMGQMKEKPGAVDIIVTVRAEAQYQKGQGYTVGDTVVRVGDNLSLRFPNYTGVGSCINIERVSN
ncbi:MAG: DUF4330 family protein [Clostridia bacterium]|nr:DUF4330 family protein [Clostridia bacterium]